MQSALMLNVHIYADSTQCQIEQKNDQGPHTCTSVFIINKNIIEFQIETRILLDRKHVLI